MNPVGTRSRIVLATLATLLFGIVSCRSPAPDIMPGVTLELARHRADRIDDLRYRLHFRIPESRDARVAGSADIRFDLSDASHPLVLDFTAPDGSVLGVRAQVAEVSFEARDGHIIIPAAALARGANRIEIEFLAGDLSLNRSDDLLYTLFVPDRASSAFPAFDQPDLKARFELTLETPADWKAVANGSLVERDGSAERVVWSFAETEPISTYLFSFAAGDFQVERGVRDGRSFHMYHRETDTTKVRRNSDAIFDLHATALAWLEEYTGIPYPFGKFDFVLIDAFQYNGMEHPGAILYRAGSLLLDESATQAEQLGRASLIAHETAHMWFGNLVTMRWFDDVWMKEVFANFMAAKIVNPSFPDIDHDLRFFLAHHPAAYAVDRTAGANPIRQPLDNLMDAGTLYGAIIYQKAPIVMRQLEALIGEDTFREGLREYLAAHRFGNATWPDLIDILDRLSTGDLASWSQVWVNESGRPTIGAEVALDGDRIAALTLSQRDPREERGLTWTQPVELLVGDGTAVHELSVLLDGAVTDVPGAEGLPAPSFVLAGSDGVGYGRFALDDLTRDYLLERLPDLEQPLHRAVAWYALWDAMLEGEVAAADIVTLALRSLPLEPDEQNVQRTLGYLVSTYWRYLTPVERDRLGPRIEQALWHGLETAPTTARKATYFDAFVSAALTRGALDRLERIWRGQLRIDDLPLAERRFTRLAQELAVRDAPNAAAILDEQRTRIDQRDRRAQFDFVRPALSTEASVRDSMFNSLRDARNRVREPWVLEALGYLHHPLRATSAEAYILSSLELLEEIQATGDIFFPQRWLGATLGGHASDAAATIVREFLDQRPDYPPRLRAKILQEADGLFRASALGGTEARRIIQQ